MSEILFFNELSLYSFPAASLRESCGLVITLYQSSASQWAWLTGEGQCCGCTVLCPRYLLFVMLIHSLFGVFYRPDCLFIFPASFAPNTTVHNNYGHIIQVHRSCLVPCKDVYLSANPLSCTSFYLLFPQSNYVLPYDLFSHFYQSVSL